MSQPIGESPIELPITTADRQLSVKSFRDLTRKVLDGAFNENDQNAPVDTPDALRSQLTAEPDAGVSVSSPRIIDEEVYALANPDVISS